MVQGGDDAMNVRWWSALQPVWNVGWCALMVQHHMWIVLAVLALRWVMISGTVLVLVFRWTRPTGRTSSVSRLPCCIALACW
jgi:hypothetical protein